MCFPAAFPFATAVSRLSSATRSFPGVRQFLSALLSITLLQSKLVRGRFVLLAYDSDHLTALVGIEDVALVCNVIL